MSTTSIDSIFEGTVEDSYIRTADREFEQAKKDHNRIASALSTHHYYLDKIDSFLPSQQRHLRENITALGDISIRAADREFEQAKNDHNRIASALSTHRYYFDKIDSLLPEQRRHLRENIIALLDLLPRVELIKVEKSTEPTPLQQAQIKSGQLLGAVFSELS